MFLAAKLGLGNVRRRALVRALLACLAVLGGLAATPIGAYAGDIAGMSSTAAVVGSKH